MGDSQRPILQEQTVPSFENPFKFDWEKETPELSVPKPHLNEFPHHFLDHTTSLSPIQNQLTHLQNLHLQSLKNYVTAAQIARPHCEDRLALLGGFSTQRAPCDWIHEKAPVNGYFLKWNHKGIAINPGQGFLDNLHQKGYFVTDIDFVILTIPSTESLLEIKRIYDLNYRCHTVTQKLHLIHYYVHAEAYQETLAALPLHFKQERNAIHPLEFYSDSPDVETLSLHEGISLKFFHPNREKPAPRSISKEHSAALGIALELEKPKEPAHSLTIGFISNMGWSPALASYLNRCEILIAGFEQTDAEDINQSRYNSDSLGYSGCYSLLQEIQPHLFICSEFSEQDGDIRLDVIKKMRNENAENGQGTSCILPADLNLEIDCKELHILCTSCGTLTFAKLIHVAKSKEAFVPLHFICPNCMTS